MRARFEVRYACQQLEKLPEGFTVPEARQPWGTAHAILVAEEAISDAPFAVINADDYGPQNFKLIYDYLSTHADGRPLPTLGHESASCWATRWRQQQCQPQRLRSRRAATSSA